jgi:acetamidase/formamidase
MPSKVVIDGRKRDTQQTTWSRGAIPVASVTSGERFRVVLPDSSSGQLGPESSTRDLATLDFERVDAAVGPIAVEGAHAGDRLDVRLHQIRPADWGWSGVFREFGMLRGQFDDELQLWSVGRSIARPVGGFLPDVTVPVRPMLGWVGVAPRRGRHPLIPPRRTGGNLDHRGVVAGAVLSLPVEVDGALLSLGDPHAAQGDGEVCGTGVETPAVVDLEVEVVRGAAPAMPFVTSPDSGTPPGPRWAALGVGPDLRANAVAALEGLLSRLEAAGLERRAGYLLVSVAGELRITEAVDLPNLVVSASLPKRLIVEATRHKGPRGSPRRGTGLR